ncbi:MAG: hypothetical protein WA268_17575 [Xanthobacteraceae bacterium]
MGTIIQFLREQTAFDPEATSAMSEAFEAACRALKLPDGDANGREAIAAQIIELARRGERDATRLRDCVLRDAGAAQRSIRL